MLLLPQTYALAQSRLSYGETMLSKLEQYLDVYRSQSYSARDLITSNWIEGELSLSTHVLNRITKKRLQCSYDTSPISLANIS